jgi:hypothetical protein
MDFKQFAQRFSSGTKRFEADFDKGESQLAIGTFTGYSLLRTAYPKGVVDARDGNFFSA